MNKISIGFKLKKYIGSKVIMKDNMGVGTVANIHVYKDDNGEYAVDYIVSADYPHLQIRKVKESDIIILIDSMKG